METLIDHRTTSEGEFMIFLDLTKAYLLVPIQPGHRRFLRFCLGNDHRQFRVLLFNLSTAPRAFTKFLGNTVASLRIEGVHVHLYLDDPLIQSRSRSISDTLVTIQRLREHGFLMNLKKSNLSPSQRIEHLGMIIDMTRMALFLTQDWMQKTVGLATRMAHLPHCLVATLA